MSRPGLRARTASVPEFVWLLAGSVALALLTYALIPSAHVGYDASYQLASAQEIWAGQEPGYALAVPSPTPHPLVTLVTLLIVPAGAAAFTIFLALSLLIYGALLCGAGQLGARIAGWPAGVVATVAVFASAPITQLAARTYVDVWSACAVVWAVALELRTPRRGWPVVVLLTLAGLLRPEAWILAGAYWLHLFPGTTWPERIRLGAITAAGPALWVLHDWLLTGDLLHARTQNTDAAERLSSTLDVADLWPTIPSALDELLAPAIVIGAIAGTVYGWLHGRRETVTLVAAAVISGATTGNSRKRGRKTTRPASAMRMVVAPLITAAATSVTVSRRPWSQP